MDGPAVVRRTTTVRVAVVAVRLKMVAQVDPIPEASAVKESQTLSVLILQLCMDPVAALKALWRMVPEVQTGVKGQDYLGSEELASTVLMRQEPVAVVVG
jgi:hypothetical protein